MKAQKDSLMDEFKKAKDDGDKPYFKANINTGDYCLHIGKIVVKPKQLKSSQIATSSS